MTDPQFLANIGNRIKTIRLSRKLSQTGVAKACGCEKSSLSRIEAGKTNITLVTLRKLCRALDCEVADCFPQGVR